MRSMVRTWQMVVMLLAFGTLMVSSALGQSRAIITLSSMTVGIGDTGVVEARVECGDIYCSAVDVILNYDTGVIEINSIEIGPYLGENPLILKSEADSVIGEVHIAGTAIDNLASRDEDLLFTITFTAIHSGNTQFRAERLIIGDLEPLPASLRGGVIRVTQIDAASDESSVTRAAVTREAVQFECLGAPPSRLAVGDIVRIVRGETVNLRPQPGTDGSPIARIRSLRQFAIIGGPECVNGYVWWEVSVNRTQGWAAEGDDAAYWMERIDQDSVDVEIMERSPAAFQTFEGGYMIWLEFDDLIYVLYDDGSWETYPDTFREGSLETDTSIIPPPGRFQPRRGFGIVWRGSERVREDLGWALHFESAYGAEYEFDPGTGRIVITGPEAQTFVLEPTDRWTEGRQ